MERLEIPILDGSQGDVHRAILRVLQNGNVLPDYWLERPPLEVTSATRAAVEDVVALRERAGGETVLDVGPILEGGGDVTTWQFLCALAERCEIAFHGTGDPGIESFEPRQPIDFAPFGHQKAVFATTDPIWAMFYAIVDRDRHRITLNNGCILLLDDDGRPGVPHYYFSITDDVLDRQPWRTGYVYFLPADTFVAQPAGAYGGRTARVPQLASPVAVTPFARVRVGPEDFPFLAQIRGHEDSRLGEYAQAVMAAAPWPL